MTDLILRPSTLNPAKPWALQLRYHGPVETDYLTLVRVSDEIAPRDRRCGRRWCLAVRSAQDRGFRRHAPARCGMTTNSTLSDWLNGLVRANHPVIRRLRETAEEMCRNGDFGTDVTDLSDAEFIALLTEGPRPPEAEK
jgi:hypothetical protein